MRPVSYATQGAPQVFGQILGVFLVGVAAGAWKAKQLCEAGLRDPIRRLADNFVLAGAVYFLALPLFGSAMVVSRGLGVPLAYILVGVVAYLMGLVLPLLARLDGGFEVERCTRGRGVLCVCRERPRSDRGAAPHRLRAARPLQLRRVRAPRHGTHGRHRARPAAPFTVHGSATSSHDRGTLAMAATALLLYRPLYLQLPERLLDGPSYSASKAFSQVVQNRSGVLAVRHGARGEMLYGGGIYDGSFNVNVVSDGNDVKRAFLVGALHPRPRRVLEIGLATRLMNVGPRRTRGGREHRRRRDQPRLRADHPVLSAAERDPLEPQGQASLRRRPALAHAEPRRAVRLRR